MKKIIAFSLFLFFVTNSQAQKKLIPATKSTVTGIDLPTGSKQDGRVLSQSMAGILMETESDKRKTKLRTAEVLVLPPASVNKDTFVQSLSSKNWKIIATEGDNYLWLQQDKRFVIAYFSIDKKETSLYFAETISVPDFNAPAQSTTSNQPAAQPNQGTNKAIATDGKQQSNKVSTAPIAISGTLVDYVWKSHQNRKDGMGGNAGYSTNSYQFYSNGTYKFTNTTFQYYTPKYYLVFEEGTYQLDGSKITLKPVTSKFETHQKEKTDPVLKSGNMGLEETEYSFEYTTIYDRLRLVLSPTTSSESKRDGGFNFYSNGAITKSYLYDAESKELKEPETIEQPAIASNVTINSPLVGIWRRGTGISGYGGWSSTGYQYTFNANGTYTYIVKTYTENDPETLLTRESGNYTMSGNTITLDPKRNVIEAWSKSNGGDNYKALITSQNKPLEKTTYQFSIQPVPELKETGLFLIYGTETARDGKYNGAPNGWRFSPSGPDYKPIKMPGE